MPRLQGYAAHDCTDACGRCTQNRCLLGEADGSLYMDLSESYRGLQQTGGLAFMYQKCLRVVSRILIPSLHDPLSRMSSA